MSKYIPYLLQGSNLILTSFLGFIFLPLISNYLPAKDVGLYAQMFAIFSLGILITNSGTANYNYRFLNNNNSGNFKNSLSTFFIFLVISLIIVNIYFFTFDNFKKVDLLLLLILLVIYGIFKFFHSILYANQLHKEFVGLNLLEATSRYLLALIFVYLGLGYSAYFIGNIISSFIVIIVVMYLFRNKIKFLFKAEGSKSNTLKYTVKYASLYTMSGMSLWILTSIDILLIGYIISDEKAGIYSLGYTLGFQMITFILMILNNVFEPKILSMGYVTDETYYNLNKLFCSLSIPLIIFIVINSKLYYGLFLNDNFSESAIITNLIVFSSFMWGIFKISSIKFAKDLKPKLFTRLVILAAGLNILLNIMLISKNGIIGAAISSIISYFLLAIVSLLLIFSYKLVFHLILYVLLLSTFSYLFLNTINKLEINIWINQGLQISALLLIYLSLFLSRRRKN